jgi:RHS repeat-associated protein
MDPNRNRSAVAYDALGMVVGTALKGNPEQILGDSLAGFEPDLADSTILDHLANPFADPHSILARATTRLVYDLFAYHRTKAKAAPQPAVIYTMVRETHDTDLEAGLKTKIQHSFSYSDGFGRDIQKKIQAEPGPVPKRDGAGEIILGPAGLPEMTSGDTDPRWVGSGWTIFNNKGKPVRQYEPFFTDTHGLDFDVRIGVSPVLFYDPAQRVIATLRPNKTWEKVVFDPWRQESWDVNDTVLVADPGTDPDVGAYFRRLSQAEYLPTWFAQRQGGALSSEEQASAAKAAVHAGTPLVAHVDSLARTFMTVTHNKFKYSDAAPVDPPIEEFHRTRLLFDIKGNQREVIDANDRLAIRYDYDMLGSRIHQASMEAGERWILNDVLGNPLYAWDGRGHRFRTVSDQLRRPAASFLSQGDGAELLVGRSEYGEARANPEMNNLRGKLVRIFDQAGIITSENYDFKGNLLRSTRQLALEYKATLDWSAPVPLKAEVFVDTSRFDALNRPIERVTPDGSVIHNAFNEANLLERVDANLRGDALASAFVTGVEYDAMGQRTSVEYGNGVRRIYELDQLTHRLAHTRTLRGGVQLQDLSYSYDPAGNITSIRDDGQQTIYFNGQVVEAHNDYIYDSLYRLIDAKGREHIGQLGRPEFTWDDHFRVRLPHPNDGQAMRRYTEQYRYDAVGNFLHLIHLAMNGNWSRSYAYDAPSLLEPDKAGNRLSSTSSGSTSPVSEFYSHDVHGNMNTMPHLALMQWDFRDQLQRTARQVVSHGSPETTYHVYDASGERVRKVTERQNGTRKKERTYLDGFEVYREFDGAGSGVALERETLHLSDDHQRIVLVETRTQGSDGSPVQLQRFQLGSHLGSASLELDEQGQVISFEEYTPYGSTSYQAVDSQTEAPKRYRYTGTERDEETGLNYHGARYYVPWLGRWLSADPIGLNGGINLFSYARGDPIGHSDTNGFEPDKGSYESRLNAVKSVVARSDRNFDRRITGKELFDAIQCSTVPFADFQEFGLMAAGGYRLDPLAASILSPPPPRFPSSEELQRRQEQNENLLRAGSDGINYTRRERREAGEKWLNRHRDPKRLLATVEFGAATLAPQYYFPAKSIYHSATGDPEQASLALAQGLLARFWGGSSTPKPSPQGGGAARALGGPAHESVNRWVPQSIRGGGRLWVSRGPVTGSGIKRLIARAGRSGRQTTILSGTHGDTYGRIGPSAEFDPRNLLTVGESTGGEFLIDDISVLAGRGHAPGVRVMDVTRMSERELDIALSGGGDIYAAWCHSALSCAIGRAFNRINARP